MLTPRQYTPTSYLLRAANLLSLMALLAGANCQTDGWTVGRKSVIHSGSRLPEA